MKACKHLDYSEKYSDSCDLVQVSGFAEPVRYWFRHEVPYPEAPRKVQFCGQGRGRINSILACYYPGEMSCYDPEPAAGTKATPTTPDEAKS